MFYDRKCHVNQTNQLENIIFKYNPLMKNIWKNDFAGCAVYFRVCILRNNDKINQTKISSFHCNLCVSFVAFSTNMWVLIERCDPTLVNIKPFRFHCINIMTEFDGNSRAAQTCKFDIHQNLFSLSHLLSSA